LEVSFQSEFIPSLHFFAITIATKCIKHELRKQFKSVYRLSGHIRDYSTSPTKNRTDKLNVYTYTEGIDLLQAQEPQQT